MSKSGYTASTGADGRVVLELDSSDEDDGDVVAIHAAVLSSAAIASNARQLIDMIDDEGELSEGEIPPLVLRSSSMTPAAAASSVPPPLPPTRPVLSFLPPSIHDWSRPAAQAEAAATAAAASAAYDAAVKRRLESEEEKRLTRVDKMMEIEREAMRQMPALFQAVSSRTLQALRGSFRGTSVASYIDTLDRAVSRQLAKENMTEAKMRARSTAVGVRSHLTTSRSMRTAWFETSVTASRVDANDSILVLRISLTASMDVAGGGAMAPAFARLREFHQYLVTNILDRSDSVFYGTAYGVIFHRKRPPDMGAEWHSVPQMGGEYRFIPRAR